MFFTKLVYKPLYGMNMYTPVSCACCGERTDRYGRCTNIECDE